MNVTSNVDGVVIATTGVEELKLTFPPPSATTGISENKGSAGMNLAVALPKIDLSG